MSLRSSARKVAFVGCAVVVLACSGSSHTAPRGSGRGAGGLGGGAAGGAGGAGAGAAPDAGEPDADAGPSEASVPDSGPADADGTDAASPACLPLQTAPGNYYVAATGSDAGDGSPNHPWATISHAATLAKPGDTIHVLPGTYVENVITACTGTASARIRFLSDCRWGARVAPSGGTAPVWLNGVSPKGDYVDIIGFEIDGSATSAAVGILNEGSYARTLGNHVHHIPAPTGCTDANGGAGIDDANYAAHDDDVLGNLVHDIGGSSIGACPHGVIHGIYHASLRGHIQNNLVYRAEAFGIHLWHAANNVVVTNNTVFDNGWHSTGGYVGGGIIVGAGDKPGGVTDDDTTVSNNVVYDNGGIGIRDLGAVGPNNRYIDNLVFGNGQALSITSGTVTGTVTADVQFVDYDPMGTGDYHLEPTSPAIDKGSTTCAAMTPACAPTIDFAGGTRPVGAAWDIGAYEHGAPAAAWPWFP